MRTHIRGAIRMDRPAIRAPAPGPMRWWITAWKIPFSRRRAPGPFPWDAPNRFLTWGWAPLPKRLLPRSRLRFLTRNRRLSYLAEYHTGFPFNVVNEEGYASGSPNSRRFPPISMSICTSNGKFRALHYLWAWRFGFNNITQQWQSERVNNNIDSPLFLTYGRGQLRALSVRLRFLGKR